MAHPNNEPNSLKKENDDDIKLAVVSLPSQEFNNLKAEFLIPAIPVAREGQAKPPTKGNIDEIWPILSQYKFKPYVKPPNTPVKQEVLIKADPQEGGIENQENVIPKPPHQPLIKPPQLLLKPPQLLHNPLPSSTIKLPEAVFKVPQLPLKLPEAVFKVPQMPLKAIQARPKPPQARPKPPQARPKPPQVRPKPRQSLLKPPFARPKPQQSLLKSPLSLLKRKATNGADEPSCLAKKPSVHEAPTPLAYRGDTLIYYGSTDSSDDDDSDDSDEESDGESADVDVEGVSDLEDEEDDPLMNLSINSDATDLGMQNPVHVVPYRTFEQLVLATQHELDEDEKNGYSYAEGIWRDMPKAKPQEDVKMENNDEKDNYLKDEGYADTDTEEDNLAWMKKLKQINCMAEPCEEIARILKMNISRMEALALIVEQL